jgi:hypothetical protein
MVLRKKLITILFAVISIVFTLFYFGIDNVGLTNTSVLLNYDNISDFLSLKFFINDIWHFPLGLNPNYGNISSSIVFSGAVPIISFIVKIFNKILPFNFHFFSVWIFFCFFLQLFFSFKIIYFYTKNYNFSFIGSFFFLISPTLIERIFYHYSLGAHWLILSVLYFEITNSKKYINLQRTILICLSSLIHFYFTPMLYLIILIFMLDKLIKDKNFYFFFKVNFIILFFLVLVMFIAGYFVIPAVHSIGYGYGIYKANLLSFIDPKSFFGSGYSWSLILKDIYNTESEYEGFSYLGLGIISIFFYLLFFYKKIIFKLKKNYKFFFIFFFFFILAISSTIHLGKYLVLNLVLPDILYAPLSVIRATGRFIWPSYYIILLGAIIFLYKINKSSKILLFFLFFQIIDFSGALKSKFLNNSFSQKNFNLNYDKKLISNFKTKEMSLKTTYIDNESNIFLPASNILINESFKNTNIFRVGRYNRVEVSKLRAQQYLDFNNNNFDKQSIYLIPNIDHLRQLKFLFEQSQNGFFFRDDLIFFIPDSKFLMNESDAKNLKNTKFNLLKKNKPMDIKFRDPNGFLGTGWSHNLEGRSISIGGSWSEGYSSSIFFRSHNSEKVKFIKLNISSAITNDKDMLKLEFYLNNKKIKLLEIPENFNQSVYLVSQKNLINGLNYLKINVINPTAPVSKLKSVDGRLLGFKLDTIELK